MTGQAPAAARLRGEPGGTVGRVVLAVVAVAVWVAALVVNERLWDRVVYGWAGLAPGSRLGSAVHFFITDVVKIALLLAGIIFAVSVLRTFVTLERTRALLGGRREGVGNVLAAGLGVATPFCSCSAVPAFIGFVSAGVPLGVTLSFLIASPLVNEVAVVLLYGLFGFKVAALYVVSGLVIAVGGGALLGRMRLERYVEGFVYAAPAAGGAVPGGPVLSWPERLRLARGEVATVLRRIWPYLLVGIALGAVIHGWVPEAFFVAYAGPGNPFAPLVAVAVGVPLYSNAAGVLPLVQALHAKGLAMGTLLAFMMSTVALSLPELILLRRVLKPRLLATFVAVVAVAILAIGYLFNAVL